jgi:hypothetical protein
MEGAKFRTMLERVRPLTELGLTLPPDIQGAIDVALMLQNAEKAMRADPPGGVGVDLRKVSTTAERKRVLAAYKVQLAEAVAMNASAATMRKEAVAAQNHAVGLFWSRAGTELVDMLKPDFNACVEVLSKVKVAATATYDHAVQQQAKTLAGYRSADEAMDRMDHLQGLATALAKDWEAREPYAFCVRWDPASLSEALINRLRGDPYARSSGGMGRPIPTTREILAEGGIPRLLNAREAKMAIEAYEQSRREAHAVRQARGGVRLVGRG